MNTDVYCPNKFSYLKVDLEKRLLYNCYKAYPHQIKTEWLEKLPIKDEKEKLKMFLKEICERRNISLEHFPANFLNWLKI